LSHSWEELNESLMAESQWNSAVNEADDRLGALNTLLDLAGRWGKTKAQEELLLRIAQRYPDATWAQQGLERLYLSAGDTPKLYQFYAGQLARSPQNVAIKNNLAATALLLKTNLPQAYECAAEIYVKLPKEAVIVSTYAYALHLQGRNAEALAAFQKIPPAQLEQPSVALYYGLLLTANGDSAHAARFLAIAEISGQMLPEEKALLAAASAASREK
jgi:tetratricopeptide (TPR) repeat protein